MLAIVETVRDEGGSFLPCYSRSASSATHHCGARSCPATPDPENPCALTRTNKETKPWLRALPWRSARGFPTVFRASLVQTFASLVLRFAPDGRYPSPCALPPRLRQEAFGM